MHTVVIDPISHLSQQGKMGRKQKEEESIEQFKQIYERDIDYRDVADRVDAYYMNL